MAASYGQLRRFLRFKILYSYAFFVYCVQIFNYCEVMLKSNKMLYIFLSKRFGDKCKHTELALSFEKHILPLMKLHHCDPAKTRS